VPDTRGWRGGVVVVVVYKVRLWWCFALLCFALLALPCFVLFCFASMVMVIITFGAVRRVRGGLMQDYMLLAGSLACAAGLVVTSKDRQVRAVVD
jgi:hypothetical protein